MRTSWEKLTQYIGTTYGQDISNKLKNKRTVTLAEPVYPSSVMARHTQREKMIRTAQDKIKKVRLAQQKILEKAVKDGVDPEAVNKAEMKLVTLQNAIAEGEFKWDQGVPIELTAQELHN
jgi:hypothetical protein